MTFLTSSLLSSQRGKDKYIATSDYKAKAKDQISVKKGDIVYVVSNKKHDKKWLYGHVSGSETLGLVPARNLHKEPDENHVNEDGKNCIVEMCKARFRFLNLIDQLSTAEFGAAKVRHNFF